MAKYTFSMITSGFVESIHVKLSNKTIDFVVSKVSWKNYLLKFINIFNDELSSRGGPICDFVKLLILDKKILYIKNLISFSYKTSYFIILSLLD